MSAEPDLLPLPEWCQGCGESLPRDMQAYARACVAHATAAKDAEIEGLRAEVKEARRIAIEHADARAFADDRANMAEARAERLAEALRRLVNSFPEEGVLLDAGWDGCEVDEACEAYDAAHAALAQESNDA